ncbi:MAG TPA: FHA domain-containing protein [Acidimicrobiales bacterium]|nr:FHA domain-containing protein [Acidimicrobiales bacterium]
MAEVYCNTCGHRNPASANFCSSCGSHIDGPSDEHTISLAPVEAGDVADDDVTVGLEDLPSGAGTLVVTRGPGAGSRFLLDADVVQAGRHPESDIFLDDVTVSRRHAELVRSGGSWAVRDVGSLNGTYVNRQRIEDEVGLTNGDEVQIGRFKLVFLAPS